MLMALLSAAAVVDLALEGVVLALCTRPVGVALAVPTLAMSTRGVAAAAVVRPYFHVPIPVLVARG